MRIADAGGFAAKGSAICVLVALLVAMALPACGGEEKRTLHVVGIPDQSVTRLARRYGELTSYLERELDVDVKYIPTVDYAATVTAFRQGSVQLGWFGGLTGVMARREVPGFVAAGGLGREFRLRMSYLQYDEVALLLLCYFVLVVGVDLAAAGLRRLAR